MFSLPAGTEMFHFPAFPPHTLCVQVWVTAHDACRVSPFGHPRIKAWLTAPRGLSRPPTSFIGSWCQGIHRAPLKTWPQRCSRPLCSSQTTTNHPSPRTNRRVHWGRHRRQRSNRPYPQTPNSVPEPPPSPYQLSTPRKQYCTASRRSQKCRIINVPPMSNHRRDVRRRNGSGPPGKLGGLDAP